MSKREELKAALTQAEAELARAVIEQAKGDASPVIGADLEKQRAHCRRARAALAELNRSEPTLAPGAATAKSTQRSPEAPKAGTPPGLRPAQPGAHLVRERKRARKQAGLPATVRRLIGNFPGLKPGVAYASSWSVFARQFFMLLALVLAYLQYYFFDVNLQIVRLPSITTLIFT